MCETSLKLQIVFIVLAIVFKGFHGFDDGMNLEKYVDDRKKDACNLFGVMMMIYVGTGIGVSEFMLGNGKGLLFTVTRAPKYFGILQDHRGQPLSVEVSEEYMDQDYIATNRKRHKMMNWNKNPLEVEDVEDEDTEETLDYKDKDVKVPGKFNLQAGLV